MYLQRIELQGFKSFAKRTILEFPAPGKGCQIAPNLPHRNNQLARGLCGITTIVGPNGSGKSNIVDAVRWVLGEQSLKLLRGKKATDVIFSGSASKNQLGLAEVSLYLNNEDNSAPIDYSEVVITRKLYRDGASEYLFNKNQVRLFDIVMLLARSNFGQNTYSVIGQGMIDRIVNFSTQERKDFFDEATGVKQFQLKRDKSINKLRRSRENLAQAQTLVKELEPHLRSLTRQVNRLHKRQAVEAELRELQIKYYGKLWLGLDLNYQQSAIVFTSQDKSKIKLENEISGLEQKLDEFSRERSRTKEFNRLQNESDQQISQRNNLLEQLAEVKGKINVEYFKIGKPDLSWLSKHQDEIALQIKDLNRELAEIKRQIEDYQQVFAEKSDKQREFLVEFKALEERLLQLQKEFQSELGVSEREIRQIVNRIYSLYKDFIGKLNTIHDLDSLAKLKIEAGLVFTEVETFYQKISQQEKRQQSKEMGELQSQLSDFLKTRDLLVEEANETKIKLEIAVSQKKSLLAKLTEFNAASAKIKNELKKNKLLPENQEQVFNEWQQERQILEKQIETVESSLKQSRKKIDEFNEAEERKKKEVFFLQQKIHQHQTELNQVVAVLNEVKVELAKIETKKDDLFINIRQDLGADYRPKLDQSLKGIDLGEFESQIGKLKKQLGLIGGTDSQAEKEHQEVKARYDFLSRQSEDLAKAISDSEKVVKELDKKIKKQFEDEFKKINRDFSRYFKKLFDGGSAKLVLVKKQEEQTEAEIIRDEIAVIEEKAEIQSANQQSENQVLVDDNLLAAKFERHLEDQPHLTDLGIDIEVSPPGKKIKNISILSGGEKTMTALALICAIINNNPSPFILFDEVDAALDEPNSAKFSGIIEELSHKTQFVIITHNRAVMARANILYGVTMQGDGISRLIGLKLDEAEKMGK